MIKPKNSEVGKWKKNETKNKRIKPTFDMLLSKYASQAAGSSSNRPSHSKRSRLPPEQEFRRYARPYGSWAPTPWMSQPSYAPYYMRDFNEGWGQPPMAPYAFHMGGLLEICPRGNNKIDYYYISLFMIIVYYPC